ncbi:ATP-binding protein [Amylibacter sp.]|jgi:two-component system phosphate regulon sensor histidine kinase PhoR|nr:GHKL domain-containing protein [Rhodobacterales bacterium]MDA8757359.1 ATP-binding protein [Amylibacter sp.]MBT4322570.1 GHKL domain-containing protein [Rhodobacterales bacterium]MBT6895452.1 GHKL domain-containing protein [Rhodobacterales bacterium]MDA9032617.1 ATP-binding protein [Amylibacter sp.]
MKKSVRYILNGLTLPVFVVDPNRKISFINKSAKMRYTEAYSGQLFSELISSKKCIDALEAVLNGVPNASANVILQEVVPTSFRVSLSRLDADSEPLPSCVLSFEDVSHIQEAEQMRHDFVANVSHELRSPLTALSGFVETLQGNAANDKEARERFLEMMSNEADRMARLIGDLLSLSKLQASERVAPTEQVDLFKILSSVSSSLSGLAERNSIKLNLNFSNFMPLVTGDADELTQVFQNLIENAIKYSGNGSVVSVSFKPPKEGKSHLCISIEDTGEGIDPAQIPRLTERFYRVDKGRSRAQGGTGLGLAIVKHILIRHRGWLKISSQLGKGSVFAVYLPVFAEKKLSQATPA